MNGAEATPPEDRRQDSLDWANSAAANTEKFVDLGSPNDVARQSNGGLLVIVRNPSTITELAGESARGVHRQRHDAVRQLTTLTAIRANADGEAFLVDAGLLTRARIVLKNSTLLGGADAFSAQG